MTRVFSFFISLSVFLISCTKDHEVNSDQEILNKYLSLPGHPYNYNQIEVPPFLDKSLIEKQDNTPVDGEVSDQIATLGRVLFYDKNLSINKSVSCASCHHQKFGFSDTARFSKGHANGVTKRHSMGLANARFRTSALYFWDGRANGLEDQVLKPIQDAVEMNLTLDQLIDRVKSQPYYPILFNRAYGSAEVDTGKIASALAQFVRSMQSFKSAYDEGRMFHHRDSSFSNFTDQENFGKLLFFDFNKGNCSGCHATDAFVMDIPRNNGLLLENNGSTDIGQQGSTGDPLDRGKFIAPSLRNIGLRPPYMHDGRFQTLKEVITHYSDGVTWSQTLDPHLHGAQPNSAKRFNLSNAEKEALVAFLKTLTDYTFIEDERFRNPFIE